MPINKALGSYNGDAEIVVRFCGDVMAHISRNSGPKATEKNKKRVEKITVEKLDSILQNQRVDFIKLDVEGSEADVLRGSSDIIRKYRPRIAMAAYHRPGDIKELPNILKDIEKNYQCALVRTVEDDFYCSYKNI